MAEFTNANFVSEDTNLDFNPYPGPVVTNTYTYEEVEPQVTDLDGATYNNVTVRYVGNAFTDAYTGATVNNDRLSAFSVFDFVHRRYSPNGIYSLTDRNYQSYADLLIPRAVGYSAGLINYFFRGQVALLESPDHPGFYTIKNLSSEDMNGTFKLFYDDVGDVRHEVPGAVWNLQIPANGESELITLPLPVSASLPQPKGTDKLVLAFTGSMGQETSGAIAGKIVACADGGAGSAGGQTNITPIAPLDLIAKHKEGQMFAPMTIDGVVRLANKNRPTRYGVVGMFCRFGKAVSPFYDAIPDAAGYIAQTGIEKLVEFHMLSFGKFDQGAIMRAMDVTWLSPIPAVFEPGSWSVLPGGDGYKMDGYLVHVYAYGANFHGPYEVLAGCAGGPFAFKSETDAALWLSENLVK